ncbi:MAG: hypothetical protein R8G33_02535 [Gammaproteobacteria bacterium]|nr:hypothetical protein [Gammaproteobacteria bacterium]
MKSKSQKLIWSDLLASLFTASAYTYMVVDSFFKTGDFCISMPGRGSSPLGCLFDFPPFFIGITIFWWGCAIHFFLKGIGRRGFSFLW